MSEEGWRSPQQVEWYLSLADGFPHRAEGEAVLLEQLSPGAGHGRPERQIEAGLNAALLGLAGGRDRLRK